MHYSVSDAVVLQFFKFSRDFLQSFCYYQEDVFLNSHFSLEKEQKIVQMKEQRVVLLVSKMPVDV